MIENPAGDVVEAALTPASVTEPRTDRETILAEALADLLGLDDVPVDGDFFDELGADSMVMARLCARMRKRADLPSISMKDVYRHPTIRSLAAELAEAAPRPVEPSVPPPVKSAPRTSTRDYLLCGTLQFLLFVGYAYLATLAVAAGYEWIAGGSGLVDSYLRAVLFGGAGFVVVCALPVAAKWLLIGRWKPQQIRIWSLAYVRFWIVKTLIRSNPCAFLFVGSPLYVLYLRALGAKIGPRVAIFSRSVPVCTDLLTVGGDTVIRREALFFCYRAQAGRIETGPVTLGQDVLVGDRSVLDINTSMGDGAQLGHASALHSGQAIPSGERWHGSPAQRTEVNYLRVAPARCGALRRLSFCGTALLSVFLLYLPLAQGGLDMLLSEASSLGTVMEPTAGGGGVTLQGLVVEALFLSFVLFFGLVLVGLVLVVTVPRLLSPLLRPGTVYPLYGLRDRAHRAIVRLTSIKFFQRLLGDSSYIVHYLRCVGYHLSPVEQTGSNFGIQVTQANPGLCWVGTGTMVADGLAMVNEEISSSSFCVSEAKIGSRNFVGNDVTYPAAGKTGDNCLLATKAMIPLDGEVHEGKGLLGSPPFQIPRSVDRDSRFDHLHTGDALRRGLASKNRHNLRTIGIFLFARWLAVFLLTLLGTAALELHGDYANAPMALLFALSLVIMPFYSAVVERCIAGFRSLEPRYCSIYDPYFCQHERLWKVPMIEYLRVLDGTPFKSVVWRLMGVRVGKRVFDDGAHIAERTLTSLGDDCVLNPQSKVMCHSQEDGTFKSDRSAIGAGCTVGVGAFVHYGVTLGDDAVLAADSFLMKGEEVPAHAEWGGNPAREM